MCITCQSLDVRAMAKCRNGRTVCTGRSRMLHSAPETRVTRPSAPSGLQIQGCRGFLPFPQQPLRLLAKLRPQVGARERIGHVGGEEADLGAAVEALAFELDAVERLLARKPAHGVGELDLAAGATLLLLQDAEDLGLQDVAAGDDQARRRLLGCGLLDHLRDREAFAGDLTDTDYAVTCD